MRPVRISLFAFISILVISGCSASRNSLHRDRDDDRPYVPPRHNHGYSPDVEDSQDQLGNPVPPVPLTEPVPAPPAMGISRIKSVSWLNLRGSGVSGSSSTGHSACGTSDKTPGGQCSPVQSCTPQQDAVVVERVQRYREHVCGEGCLERPGFLLSRTKSIRKKLHPLRSDSCSEAYSGQPTHPQAQVHTGRPFSAEPPCTEEARGGLHQSRKPRCLADSLDEPFSEDSDPGLITPDESKLPASDGTVPRVPAAEQVPTVPMFPMPAPFEQPVPGLPVPPTLPGPSTQVIEPPVWPRLNTHYHSSPVSRSVVSPGPTSIGSGQALGTPQIIPGAHRRTEPARQPAR